MPQHHARVGLDDCVDGRGGLIEPEYAARVGLAGVVAIVSPHHPGSSQVQRLRLANTYVYILEGRPVAYERSQPLVLDP